MRIFTLRRMLGLTAIGVAYVHGKRGGDATVASISDTLRYLWSQAAERFGIDNKRPLARPAPQRTVPSPSSSTSSTSASSKMPNGLERNPRPQGGS